MDNTTVLATRSDDDGTADLVARIQAGDTSAFEELVAATQSRLMRLICRLIDSPADTEDVMQEVYVSVLQGLPRFRHASSFTTWVTRITVNTCRTYRRRASRRQWLAVGLRRSASVNAEVVQEAVTDDAEEVRNAVRQLAAKYREPVVLHYFEHQSIAEVAAILGLKTNTVEVRLSRARRQLRSALAGRLDGDDS